MRIWVNTHGGVIEDWIPVLVKTLPLDITSEGMVCVSNGKKDVYRSIEGTVDIPLQDLVGTADITVIKDGNALHCGKIRVEPLHGLYLVTPVSDILQDVAIMRKDLLSLRFEYESLKGKYQDLNEKYEKLMEGYDIT